MQTTCAILTCFSHSVLFLRSTEMKQIHRLVAFIVLINSLADASEENRWKSFKLEFNKNYKSVDEEAKRFKIFRENFNEFEAHNRKYEAGEVSFKLGVNRDADLTYDEIENRSMAHE